jgi:hypothetical protein
MIIGYSRIQIFSIVTPCRLVKVTDASNEHNALIFRVKHSKLGLPDPAYESNKILRNFVTVYQSTRRINSEGAKFVQ